MILQVKVQPRASRNQLKRSVPEGWKLYLTAPPVDGKANEAAVSFLAEALEIPRSQVRVLSGLKSRLKRIELVGVEETDVMRLTERPT